MCSYILYSTYISRVFNFANFTNLESFAKFIQLKFEPLRCNMHLPNFFNKFLQSSYLGKFRLAKYKHYLFSLPSPPLSLSLSLSQVEEYGREVYKLVKTFLSKWKQQKGKELGGGMKRDAAAMAGGKRVEEGDEFAPLKMARTAHEQVKNFKVC